MYLNGIAVKGCASADPVGDGVESTTEERGKTKLKWMGGLRGGSKNLSFPLPNF